MSPGTKTLRSYWTKRQELPAASLTKPLVPSRSDHSLSLVGLPPSGRTCGGTFLGPIYAQEALAAPLCEAVADGEHGAEQRSQHHTLTEELLCVRYR